MINEIKENEKSYFENLVNRSYKFFNIIFLICKSNFY